MPIQLKTVSDLEKKLGVYTCPTGNFLSCCTTVDHRIGICGEAWCTETPSWRCLDGYLLSTIPQTYLWSCCNHLLTTETGGKFQSICYKLLPSLCVNRNITKEYRILSLWYQRLALPNLNIDALSKKIHLLQSHWDTGSMSGRMIYQPCQVFQVEVGLGDKYLLTTSEVQNKMMIMGHQISSCHVPVVRSFFIL